MGLYLRNTLASASAVHSKQHQTDDDAAWQHGSVEQPCCSLGGIRHTWQAASTPAADKMLESVDGMSA